MNKSNSTRVAVKATLHCLTGCAIGEILGMVTGTALNLSNLATIALSILLAFIFGYSLTFRSLLRSKLALSSALKIALAADTLSITTMEIIDNLVMFAVPGALGAGLVNPVFWFSLILALIAAFLAALPVNRYLIKRGRGHALVHSGHH